MQEMDRHDLPNDWPAPDDILLELGRLTALWGVLETTVDIAISKLAGYEANLDYRALIMVVHSSFRQKIDIAETLCEQLLPEHPQLKSYSSAMKQIKNAQKARNKYAHNAVTTDEETGRCIISYASARGTLKTVVETVHINDIKEAAAKTHEASLALHGLITTQHYPPIWSRNP